MRDVRLQRSDSRVIGFGRGHPRSALALLPENR